MRLRDLTTPVFELRDVKLPAQAADIHQVEEIDGFTIDQGLHRSLLENGWNVEGSGTYSLVYRKGDEILKVFRNEYQPGTRCLIRYHRLAQKSNNPHFPKVYFVKTYRGEEHETLLAPQTHIQYFIIGTEALEWVNEKKIISTLPTNKRERKLMVGFLSSGALNIINVQTASELVGFQPKNKGAMGIRESIQYMQKLAQKYIETHQQDLLVQAYLAVVEMIQADRACFSDFGGNNIMMRKDGTLVLSDPIGDAHERHTSLR